jgi:sec-independent protein translocase protein TatA
MLNTILFISSLGFPEWIVIFGVIILLFGGKKIPELMRGIGKGVREFNSARASLEDEFKQGMRDDDRKSNNTNSAPTTKSEPEA